MKSLIKFYKVVWVLAGLSMFGLAIAGSQSVMKTENGAKRNQQVEDMNKPQKITPESRRAAIDARRSAIRAQAMERRQAHAKEIEIRKKQQEIEKEKRLNFKAQLLDMLTRDGVIESRDQDLNIRYKDGQPIANDINLYALYGDKYNALWNDYGLIMSDDSYMNITPQQYEIKEITKDGRSRHYQMSFGKAK